MYAAKVNRGDSNNSVPEVRRPVPMGEAQLEVAAAPLPKIKTFTSLRNRAFLPLWLAVLAASAGMQMNVIARGWLVWELTESAFSIGMVAFAFGVPMLLFSLFGGAIADRAPKRILLISTNTFMAFVTLVIAILVTMDMIQFWHLVAAGAAQGFTFVFDGPARQAMIPELVKRRELLNAISLNSSAMNLTRVVAPAVAGALLVVIGTGGVFYIVVGFYIAGAVAVSMIPPKRVEEQGIAPLRASPSGQSRSATLARAIWADLVEGVGYIRRNSLVLSLLAIEFIPVTFGFTYMILLPIFADEVLDVGKFGYGMLMAVSGVGALIASLSIASLGDFRRKGMLLFALVLTFGLTLIIFGLSESYALSLAILVMVGAGSTGYMTVNNTLLQSNVPHRVLGRVMSIYMLTFALMPMGALPIGALADAIGVGTTVAIGGAIVVFFILVIAILRPSLRRLE